MTHNYEVPNPDEGMCRLKTRWDHSHTDFDMFSSSSIDLDGEWMFDMQLANYLGRVKVVVESSKHQSYLEGQFDGRKGRIVAAQKNPTAYEQTVRVKFTDRPGHQEEERSIVSSFVVPVRPSYSGEEVLVLAGKRIGNALVIREKPEYGDKKVVASSKANPADIDNVPMNLVGAMYEEGV